MTYERHEDRYHSPVFLETDLQKLKNVRLFKVSSYRVTSSALTERHIQLSKVTLVAITTVASIDLVTSDKLWYPPNTQEWPKNAITYVF